MFIKQQLSTSLCVFVPAFSRILFHCQQKTKRCVLDGFVLCFFDLCSSYYIMFSIMLTCVCVVFNWLLCCCCFCLRLCGALSHELFLFVTLHQYYPWGHKQQIIVNLFPIPAAEFSGFWTKHFGPMKICTEFSTSNTNLSVTYISVNCGWLWPYEYSSMNKSNYQTKAHIVY